MAGPARVPHGVSLAVTVVRTVVPARSAQPMLPCAKRPTPAARPRYAYVYTYCALANGIACPSRRAVSMITLASSFRRWRYIVLNAPTATGSMRLSGCASKILRARLSAFQRRDGVACVLQCSPLRGQVALQDSGLRRINNRLQLGQETTASLQEENSLFDSLVSIAQKIALARRQVRQPIRIACWNVELVQQGCAL